MQKMQIWVQSSAHTMTELVRGFAAFFKLTRYTTSDAQHHTSAQQVTRAVQETPEVAAEVAGGIVGRPISAVEHPAGTRSEPLKHRLLRDRVRDVCSQHPHGDKDREGPALIHTRRISEPGPNEVLEDDTAPTWDTYSPTRSREEGESQGAEQRKALKHESHIGPREAKLRAMLHDARETVTHPRQAAAQAAARIVGRNWEQP